MRQILFIIAILCSVGCGSGDYQGRQSASEERVSHTGYEVYGDSVEIGDAVPVGQLKSTLGEADSMNVIVSGKVDAVCQKKGCWMDMELENGEVMKVTFKDYGFFVPKDGAGKNVVMAGTVKKEIISIETLQHYAEDAGKPKAEIDAITAPEEKIVFVANGVAMSKSL